MSLPGARTRYDWNAFTLAGVPVTFSVWFLLAVWVVLSRSSGFESGLVLLAATTTSVLVHELGHAFAARRYGLRPAILLHGFGGWCEHAPARRRDDATTTWWWSSLGPRQGSRWVGSPTSSGAR